MITDNTQATSRQISETVQAGQICPKVLCIDDDPNVSEALARRLHSYDVEVVRAFHGMHGFWLAVTEKPDVIITDLRMPQGEGEYVVECLKGNSETAHIPVIVLTGKSEPGLEDKLFRLGVEHFLPKPASFDEILDKLGQYVKLRKRVSIECAE
ncbi:MAG: response regulator [Planctomycetes bacterium]|nr:response regulator [Planctomycetota bacterium]